MRVHATFGQLVTSLQNRAVLNLDTGAVRNQVCLGIARLIIRDNDLTFLLGIFDGCHTAELSDDSKSLRLTCLEKLLDTRKTLCDIATGNAARVERTHGQLCTRLTDGLCRDDADCLTDLNRLTGCHVGTVALRTHTDVGFTGQDGTDLDGISALFLQCCHNSRCTLRRTHMILLNHHFTCIRVCDCLSDETSCDTLLQCLDGLLTIHECLDLHIRNLRLIPAAVLLADDQILGYVYQTSGQVTRVGSTQSRIGHTFSSSVCGDEVLQYVQTLTEVGLDRKFNRMTGRICHQSSHTSKLFNLLIRSSRTGVSHHEDVVIFVKSCQQIVSQLIIGCLPGLDNFFVTLFLCDKTTAEVLCDMVNRCLRVSNQLRLACRYGHIGNRYGHGCTRRELVANRLDIIQGDRCLGCAMDIDNLLQNLL